MSLEQSCKTHVIVSCILSHYNTIHFRKSSFSSKANRRVQHCNTPVMEVRCKCTWLGEEICCAGVCSPTILYSLRNCTIPLWYDISDPDTQSLCQQLNDRHLWTLHGSRKDKKKKLKCSPKVHVFTSVANHPLLPLISLTLLCLYPVMATDPHVRSPACSHTAVPPYCDTFCSWNLFPYYYPIFFLLSLGLILGRMSNSPSCFPSW